MKVAVVKASELGERWDAAFHLERTRVAERTSALRARHDEDEAMRLALSVPEVTLRALQPLTTSPDVSGSRAVSACKEFVRDHPHMALALLGEAADEALADIERRMAVLTADRYRVMSLKEACEPSAPAPPTP